MTRTRIRLYAWACACCLWSGETGDECEACGESPCHHFYDRETALMFAGECWDGKARCARCGEAPIVREFAESTP